MSELLAHLGGHLFSAHLQSVAGMAAAFSAAFEPAVVTQRWSYLSGLRHHLGKYRPGFQRYLVQSDSPGAQVGS